ncbi:MAG: hypothetical protein HOK99_02105 [Betaproteobacteria bacterium]|jgi:hypothetical protein|nr:hypothetical protein [Betaproteobacteria bacterium]
MMNPLALCVAWLFAGRKVWADGGKYEGGYKDGKKHGHGILLYVGGNRYEGEFKNGVRTGHGVFDWENGDSYVGAFKNDKIHGRGLWVLADGNRCEGEFREGKRYGHCILERPDGSGSEGNFVNDMLHGQGTWVGANGDRYEGDFVYGMMHGQGTWVGANGDRYEGKFKDGERVAELMGNTSKGMKQDALAAAFNTPTVQVEETVSDRKVLHTNSGGFLLTDSPMFHSWIENFYKTLKSPSVIMDEVDQVNESYHKKIYDLEISISGLNETDEKFKFITEDLYSLKRKNKSEVKDIMMEFFKTRTVYNSLFLCKNQIDGISLLVGGKTGTAKISDTYVKAYLYGVSDWYMQEFRRDAMYKDYVTWDDTQDFAVIIILFQEAYGEKGASYVSTIIDLSKDAVVVNAMMEGAKDAEAFFRGGDSQILGRGSLARYIFGDGRD